MTNKYLLTTIFLFALYGLWLQPVHVSNADLDRYGPLPPVPKADLPVRVLKTVVPIVGTSASEPQPLVLQEPIPLSF